MAAMSAGAGSSAQVSGTIRVTRTWVGSGPPPTKCYVKETANVGASAVGSIGGGPGGADDDGGGGGSTPVGTASASDGLGDAPTTGVGSETSSGSHLIQVDSSSGSITLSASINASADSAGQPVNCQAGGNATPDNQGFSWDFDSRAVTISSSIETSYYKAEEGDSGVVQGTHTRNPDGSIAVDSVVAWQYSPTSTVMGWAVNGLPLTANALEFNNPVCTWGLSGEGQLDLSTPNANPVNFSMFESSVDGFPKHSTVTVNVTDSDGAIGENTYDITWHLPYEETDSIGSIDGSSVFETRFSGADPGAFVSVPTSQAGTLPFEALLDGASEIAAEAGQEEAAGVLKIIGAIAGIVEPWSKDYEEEDGYTGAINGSDSWTAANAEDAAHSGTDFVRHVPDNVNNWTDATMSLCRVKYYTISSWHADQYDSHGYNSPGHIIQTTKITSTHDEPVFTKIVY